MTVNPLLMVVSMMIIIEDQKDKGEKRQGKEKMRSLLLIVTILNMKAMLMMIKTPITKRVLVDLIQADSNLAKILRKKNLDKDQDGKDTKRNPKIKRIRDLEKYIQNAPNVNKMKINQVALKNSRK